MGSVAIARQAADGARRPVPAQEPVGGAHEPGRSAESNTFSTIVTASATMRIRQNSFRQVHEQVQQQDAAERDEVPIWNCAPMTTRG